MKVIVAGMPKTGTKTMCAALNLLGYKTYDWLENCWYLGDDWVRIIREGGTAEDFRRMYENVDAVTDSPCNHYWEEILEAFPDAKVILTIRDEDAWHRSRVNQLTSLNEDLLLKLMLSLTYSGWRCHRFRFYDFKFLGNEGQWPWSNITYYKEEAMKKIYRKHNKYLLQNCPPEQLLMYQVSEGWGPLCRFLGVDTPPGEFPHKNKGASAITEMRRENEIMKRMQRELYFSLFCLVGLAAIGFYKLGSALGFY